MRILALSLVLAGCAPTLVAGTMDNPARIKERIESTQEYDIGPWKENHRYQITLADWTPSTIGARIHVLETGECGHLATFTFTLVDAHGGAHPLKLSGQPSERVETGRGGGPVTVTDGVGTFDAAIGPDDKSVTIQVRPAATANCPAFDFRWDLK